MGQEASRQRKLAAKAARRKAVVTSKKRDAAGGDSAAIAAASRGSILACEMGDQLLKGDFGTVTLARSLPSGLVACGAFLVDRRCLGVKDAFFKTLPPLAYQTWMVEQSFNQRLVPVDPSTARKFLHEAVAYAAALGLPAAPEYASVEKLFGDVDPSRSAETFTFGLNGRPVYITGPFDTPAKIRKISATLDRSCGKGNWDLVMGGPMNGELDFDDEEGIVLI